MWLLPRTTMPTTRTRRPLHGMVQVADVRQADLIWLCAPSSPLGQALALPDSWMAAMGATPPKQHRGTDCAYAPLQLTDEPLLPEAFKRHSAWQIYTPNKALGVWLAGGLCHSAAALARCGSVK